MWAKQASRPHQQRNPMIGGKVRFWVSGRHLNELTSELYVKNFLSFTHEQKTVTTSHQLHTTQAHPVETEKEVGARTGRKRSPNLTKNLAERSVKGRIDMIRSTRNTAVRKVRKRKSPRKTTSLHYLIQMMDLRARTTRTFGAAW